MEIRLATYNLENLGIREGEDTPEVRARLPHHVRELRRMLRRLDADAVAFQEVLDPALLRELVAGLGYSHLAVGERASSPLLLGVASRHPLREARTVGGYADFHLVDPKAGLEIRIKGSFSRAALDVVWELPTGPVALLVVHWKSKIPSIIRSPDAGETGPCRRPVPAPEGAEPIAAGTDWLSFGQVGQGRLVTEMKRLAQATELRKIIDEKLSSDPQRLLAVVGDFNDGLDSEGVRIVRGDARACQEPGLAPYELVPAELLVPPGLRFSQVYQGREEMLDHVLLSQGLVAHLVETRIYNERLARAEEGPWPDLYNAGSDHAPLVATFRF